MQKHDTDSRLGYLDVLRGIAILGVVLVHASQSVAGLPLWAESGAAFGARGVQLFFLVSAVTFLTTSSGLHGGVGMFFIRRFCRIAPMFYLGTSAFLLLNGMAAHRYAPEGIEFWHIFTHALFVHGFHPSSVNALLPGSWSIACEWTFYLFFPVLCVTINTAGRALWFLTASTTISLAALYIAPQFISGPEYLVNEFAFFSFFAQLPVFAAGFVIVHCRTHVDRLIGRTGAVTCILVSLAAMAAIAVTKSRLDHFLVSVPLLVLLVIGFERSTSWITNSRLLRRIGELSFSIYVVHHAAIILVSKWLPSFIERPLLALCWTFFLSLLAAVAVSMVTHHFIERPGIALGKWISAKMTCPAQRANSFQSV